MRRRVLAWALLPLGAFTLGRVPLAYWYAAQTAGVVYDDALLASARAIGEQIRWSENGWEALIPPSALERLGRPQRDRVAYRVEGPGGELLAGYPDTPVPPRVEAEADPVYFDALFRTQPVRLVAIAQPLPGVGDAARITVGETLQSREVLAADLWHHVAVADVLALIVTGGMVLVGIAGELAPLGRLRDAVAARPPGSLERIDGSAVSNELAPLVDSFNAAVAQASAQIAQRERLVADAAHQLRTPLALLATQAAVGLNGATAAEKDAALAGMASAASAMARLTNQLLVLARAEGSAVYAGGGAVDFRDVARRVMADLAPRALDDGVELALRVPDAPVPVEGPPVLLEELVRNLLDNAMRYASGGGEIDVAVRRTREQAELVVRDRGPGLAPDERDTAFERFYRAPGAPGDGSGLGLAIVAEIARGRGGRVKLRDPAEGPGLEVVVRLPLTASPAVRPQ